MPRGFYYTVAVLAALGVIPFALIARSRTSPTPEPRIQIVRDMGKQPKFLAQAPNPLFADGRAMRPPVEGTIPRGGLGDPVFLTGRDVEGWVDHLPVPLTAQLLQRGKERYEVFCSPCHGLSGYGDGIVARRADRLQEGTWVAPASYHGQIPVDDRWAIVAYVRALQRSQDARIEDVPPDLRAKLR